MAQPVWITPAGALPPAAEGIFYTLPLEAYDPDSLDTIYYQVIAGSLPAGMQVSYDPINQIAILSGIPESINADVTTKFVVRAYTEKLIHGVTVVDRLADRTFEITVTINGGPSFITPAGPLAQYYNGTLVDGLQILYTNGNPNNPTEGLVVTLKSGSLPPGLTILPTGLISGFVLLPTGTQGGFDPLFDPGYINGNNPSLNGQPGSYDSLPFDALTTTNTATYTFILQVSDGQASDLRSFSITVNSTTDLTADTTQITADNTFITADQTPIRSPVILTPQGSIGTVQSDNYFAFQFTAIQVNGLSVTFEMNGGAGSNIPGLTLDPESGWLYGYIPAQGIYTQDFSFTLQAYITGDPAAISTVYSYSLNVTGPIASEVIWNSLSFLGTIFNGSTSTFTISATSVAGLGLSYSLDSGSDSSLPQGLSLLPSGNIVGRVSFDTFALDGGTTNFDGELYSSSLLPTTFDLTHTFTVVATSVNGLVQDKKTFSIRVIREYNEPYENLYIQAMPPLIDRALISSLLENSDIFPESLIYRPDDPNFGLSSKVVYYHAYGLTASTQEQYYSALVENHYWRNLVLGEIKTAQALDDFGNVIYEVVYSEIIDDLENSDGVSVGKSVELPYTVKDINNQSVQTVYPNSLTNMRTQVIDTVGQISKLLPRWMLSEQADGTVLGFTPAWVIAYTNPGASGQIAYNIKSEFGINQLNKIEFDVDRYEVDRLLSKNWDAATKTWVPSPPTLTTFDVATYPPEGTTFDGGSLQFITPVDMYEPTQIYDKYLVFEKRTILG